MVLKELTFNSFYYWEGVVVLKELILTVSKGVVVLKELILTVYTLGGCGDPERTYFNTFYIWRVWWSSKN